jgi:glycerophosphoryl diester phosphodiesterase
VILALIFFVAALYFVFFWTWRKNEQKFYLANRPIIFGHRGSPSIITENTILSFEKAIEQGVEGLEFDVRLTQDKKIIIFHDENMLRLSGINVNIKDLAYNEIKTHTLKKERNQEKEMVVPLLEDFIPLLSNTKAINIEIKSESLFESGNIIKPLIKFLDTHNIDHKCIVSSFNPAMLWRLKRRRPQTVIGFLYTKKVFMHSIYNMIWVLICRPDNLHIHYDFIGSWIVRWARLKGMCINCYTINNETIYKKAIKAKIDGVFTDNIEYIK